MFIKGTILQLPSLALATCAKRRCVLCNATCAELDFPVLRSEDFTRILEVLESYGEWELHVQVDVN